MLAASYVVYPRSIALDSRNVREYARVVNLSHLLDMCASKATDETLLEAASGYFADLDLEKAALLTVGAGQGGLT